MKYLTKRQKIIGTVVILAVLLAGAVLILATKTNDLTIPEQTGGNVPQQQEQAAQANSSEQLAKSLTPCELLTAKERAQYKLGAGEADNKNIRGCKWQTPPPGGTYTIGESDKILYVGVMIYTLYGLDQMPRSQGDKIQPLKIGSHSAQKLTPVAGDPLEGVCTIDIAIGPSETATARLAANYGSSTNTAKACAALTKVAPLIEAKLP